MMPEHICPHPTVYDAGLCCGEKVAQEVAQIVAWLRAEAPHMSDNLEMLLMEHLAADIESGEYRTKPKRG